MSEQEQPATLTGSAAGRAEAKRRFGRLRSEGPASAKQTHVNEGLAEARRRFGPPPGDAA